MSFKLQLNNIFENWWALDWQPINEICVKNQDMYYILYAQAIDGGETWYKVKILVPHPNGGYAATNRVMAADDITGDICDNPPTHIRY